LFTKDVTKGVKKFLVCKGELKTNDVRQRGEGKGGVGPLHTNVVRREQSLIKVNSCHWRVFLGMSYINGD
jgi:hypothetical protein